MSGVFSKTMRRVIFLLVVALFVGCISPGRNTPLGTIEDPISLSPERRSYRGASVDWGTATGADRVPDLGKSDLGKSDLGVPDLGHAAGSVPDWEASGRDGGELEPEMLLAPDEELVEAEQGPSLPAPLQGDPGRGLEKRLQRTARPAKLFLDVRAPKRVAVGADVTYDITIRNEGAGMAEDVEVFCTFEGGLAFPGKNLTTVKRQIGRVPAGDAQAMKLTLIAKETGRQCLQFTIKSDGKEAVWKSVCTAVVQQAVSVSVVGPGRRTVESRAEFTVQITNISDRPLKAVNANLYYDDALIPREATEGAEEEEGRLSWNLGDLQRGEGLQLQVEFECSRVANRVKLRTEVSAVDQGSRQSDATLRITSLPGVLDLRVSDEEDPVGVGKKFFYVVDVQNRGFQSAQQMQLAVFPSAGIQILGAEVFQKGGRRAFRHRVHGRRWEFEPVTNFSAGARLQIRILARAIRPGNHTFRAAVKSDLATKSFAVDEPTTAIAP